MTRWILSRTPDVKVLAPRELQERVLARLEAGVEQNR
jgi:predicted DNA-binding transcriptional regulator YafY